MTATTVDEIPAALPVSESEDEREKLLKQAAADGASAASGNLDEEIDEEEDSVDEVRLAKPSKKKLFLAFVGFVFCFVLLLALLCWFFGIGVFAQTKKQNVDRTVKTNGSTTAPATEDEKLKMALNLVAEKTPSSSSDDSLTSTVNSNGDSSLSTAQPNKSTDLNEPVVVPDSFSLSSNPNTAGVAPVMTNGGVSRTQNFSQQTEKNASVSNSGKSNPLINAPQKTNGESEPSARSLFFGASKKESPVSGLVAPNVVQTVLGRENFDVSKTVPIPFGTLLPIRFLGAVFTLRASGGLVRMELTRAISGKDYSYPAGTVLVGTLRGSEYKRAFVSIVGLIDPNSGGLVKFEGEVMGGDGASGVTGRRRKIKGAWARVLSGLREVGASAAGVIGSRRSGGAAVVISDSQARASGVLSQELGGASQTGEFIEISAGTNAYILVTDLPDEVSDENRLAQNKQSATGLTDEELATLFSEGSPDKIRAALGAMTPQFRRLAEQALATMENQ